MIEDALKQIRNMDRVEDVLPILAEAGVIFFPCKPDKKPYVQKWEQSEPATQKQVKKWLADWPNMAIGLIAGVKNGIFIIDLDTKGADGIAAFDQICEQHDYDWRNATLCARTSSCGWHLYFKMPLLHELRNTASKLAPGIDTRGNGGFVIMPPSDTPKAEGYKQVYSWANDAPLAELPNWLLQLLLYQKMPVKPSQMPVESRKASKPYFSLYVSKREEIAYKNALDDEAKNLATTVEGSRNDQLNASAFAMGQYVGAGKLDEAEVYDRLFQNAQATGLPEAEIRKTLSSGLESGKRNPKEMMPHNGSWESDSQIRTDIRAADQKQPSQSTQPLTEEEKRQLLEDYYGQANASVLTQFLLATAKEFANTSAISTGFKCLDFLLDGGLYPGLYSIGAITSLGKTTFALQIADYIAATGQDVLIFSLEMSKFELMAKSVSRISAQLHKQDSKWIAKTAREILNGKWYSDEEIQGKFSDISEMLNIYDPIAEHIFLIEGCFDLDVTQVRELVHNHINLTCRKPVVFIDYLQILAPLALNATDKQNIDRAVVKLKQLSRDFKIPVIAISSFNRESYKARASLAAFKESGAIEYSSDVLIGLQLGGLKKEPSDQEVAEAKKKNPREIELLVLKNRHGIIGDVKFIYYPAYNWFNELELEKQDEELKKIYKETA